MKTVFSRSEVTLLLKKLLNECPDALNDATLNENTDWDENNLLEFAESLLPDPKRDEPDALQIIGDASNVICHLNDLIHKIAFGGNDDLRRVAYENAVDYFKRLDRNFSKEPGDRWIAVTPETMPPYNKGVLVFIPHEDYHVTSGMWDVSNKWVLLDEYRKPECEVTHWAELMDIPEEYRKQREQGYKALRFLKESGELPTQPLPSAPTKK